MTTPKMTAAEKMRDQLIRLIMTDLDFRHALSAATFLYDECDWGVPHNIEKLRRFKCYETTMVVAYGRPFAHARGQVAPFEWSLLRKRLKLDQGDQLLHEKILDLRNRVYAHSDADFTQIVSEIWRTEFPNGKVFDYIASDGGEKLNLKELEVRSIQSFLLMARKHIASAIQDHPASREGIPVKIRDLYA